jgi:hypothetical protein
VAAALRIVFELARSRRVAHRRPGAGAAGWPTADRLSGWIADYERVVRISQEQTAAHARRGARAVWTGQALYSAVLFAAKATSSFTCQCATRATTCGPERGAGSVVLRRRKSRTVNARKGIPHSKTSRVRWTGEKWTRQCCAGGAKGRVGCKAFDRMAGELKS